MKAILGIDGTEVSKSAVDLLLRLPTREKSEVILLSAMPPAPPLATGMQKWKELRTEIQAAHERARETLDSVANTLQDAGFQTRVCVREGQASHVVIDAAREENADLILVGSHDRGPLARFLLGSVSHGVMLHAGRSVLVARPRPQPDSGAMKILIAHDGSDAARSAAESAMVREWIEGAAVTVLTVHELVSMFRADILQEKSDMFHEQEVAMQEALEQQAELLRPYAASVETLTKRDSSPRESILATSREIGADLIVVGEKGHSAFSQFLLGSVAHGVANRAGCSVLVVRP